MDGVAAVGERVVLTPLRPVAGGVALAREPAGRVVFVEGAIPGETVEVEIVEERRDHARARTVAVLDAATDRVTPPCRYVADGCGGCDLQHLAPEGQGAWKRAVVVDALERIGGIEAPVVRAAAPLDSGGGRTTIRVGIRGGRAAFRRARSHDLLVVEDCLVAHPLVRDVLDRTRFGTDTTEATIRVSAASGERVVIGRPGIAGIVAPDGVTVVDADDRSGSGAVVERVAGRDLRISASSFFQSRPDGAGRLVEVVTELGGASLAGASTVVDAYGGVGLFAATLPVAPGAEVIVVERNRSSVADARHNLGRLDDRSGHVVRADVARWRPTPAQVVVADPSRVGLGRDAAGRLAATGAEVLVLVSCDPAALGRDARLLIDAGYAFDEAVVVDMFPHSHHVEVVSRLSRR